MNWWPFSTTDKPEEIAEVVKVFPALLTQSIKDWRLFTAGAERGLFTPKQQQEIIAWYLDFPKLWETIRPNFDVKMSQADEDIPTRSNQTTQTQKTADAFVKELTGNKYLVQGIGIAPIIIAGVLVAALLGIGGAIWAVGYVKKQNNISLMIEETVAGKLPPEILQAAVAEEKGDPFGLGSLKTILLIGLAIVAWPSVKPVISSIIGAVRKK